MLKCCAALLPHGDLADQAIEDLRRWGYWDLTADVLALWPKPTHSAPDRPPLHRPLRRCHARRRGEAFVAAVQQTDPKLVRDVEELLEVYGAVALQKNRRG